MAQLDPGRSERKRRFDRRRLRFLPMAVAAAGMMFGLLTGLSRLGLPLGGVIDSIAHLHGALMISGFLGTLISLERAVALGRPWGYLAPGFSALGALLLFADANLAAAMFVLAGAVLLLASLQIAVRQVALFSIVLTIAAAAWAYGSLLWLSGQTLPDIAGWWFDFLILTIAAERLELSRLQRVSIAGQAVFAGAVLLLLAGSARQELAAAQAPFTAAGFIILALWLWRHDIARRIVRQPGQPRFAAMAILAGHGWLAVAGMLLVHAAVVETPLIYDAVLHALALGVILSMIFGHAPIILPAITGIRLKVTGAAYLPLALLHLSAALRVGGDLLLATGPRQLSAIVTIIAIAGYAAVLVGSARRP